MLVQEEALDATPTQRYLDDLVRVWLGVREREVALPRLPEHLARLLLRSEEYEDERRDAWGGWPAAFSDNFRRGKVREPEIDVWLEHARAGLPRGCSVEPPWPHGKRFAVCLTHDVDLLAAQSTVQQAVRYVRAGLAPGVATRGEAVVRFVRPAVRAARALRAGIARAPEIASIERSLELEQAHGATASYFFTTPPHAPRSRYDCVYAPRDRCLFRGLRLRVADVMRALAADGFDVGLHGSYAAASAGTLAEERAFLEASTGLEITTTRQHFLRWDVRWSPAHQDGAGLQADTTMGFNFDVGFRAGTSLPFRLYDVTAQRVLDVVELPLVVQDGAIFGSEALALEPADARTLVRSMLETVRTVGGVLTLLVHPNQLERPEWAALYEWTLDLAVDHDAWLTSLGEVNAWWRAREARILAS